MQLNSLLNTSSGWTGSTGYDQILVSLSDQQQIERMLKENPHGIQEIEWTPEE
jgi:hypothetical protein